MRKRQCPSCNGGQPEIDDLREDLATERAAHEKTKKALDLTTQLMKTGEARGIAKGKEELDAVRKKLEEAVKDAALSEKLRLIYLDGCNKVIDDRGGPSGADALAALSIFADERDAALSRLATVRREVLAEIWAKARDIVESESRSRAEEFLNELANGALAASEVKDDV